MQIAALTVTHLTWAAVAAAVGSNHGWHPYSPGALPRWLAERKGERCFSDIPVLNAEDVPGHVRQDASWANRPFILRGCMGLISMQDGLGKDRLLEAAERLGPNISVGYSWSIARNGGEGPERLPLLEFLSTRMRECWYDGDTCLEPAYAFDMQAELPGLPSATEVPPLIRSWSEAGFGAPASASRITMLGAAQSAVGWHRHSAAVQMTVHGWKRWFLYPLGSYPPGDGPGGGFSITDWLRLVYPTLHGERAPLEFIQKPGDTVYIPGGWYHAVINLADSVGVSIQSTEPVPEAQEAFKSISLGYVDHLREADPAALARLEEAALRHLELHPENDLHARRVLFYALRAARPEEAARVMLEGIERDCFHVPLQFELAKWLSDRAEQGDASALELFQVAMRTWEPHLRANTRNLKALWILSKYYKLTGQTEEFNTHHSRLVELNDRGIDR